MRGHRRAGRIRSKRVIEVLGRLVWMHGAPLFLRSDNGPEFVGRAILNCMKHSGIGTAHVHPGKPLQNGAEVSFNGKPRDEYLSAAWFRTEREARAARGPWRRHQNVEPHASFGYLTSSEFERRLQGKGAAVVLQPPSQPGAILQSSD